MNQSAPKTGALAPKIGTASKCMRVFAMCILLGLSSGCFTAGAIDNMTAEHCKQIETSIQQETAP